MQQLLFLGIINIIGAESVGIFTTKKWKYKLFWKIYYQAALKTKGIINTGTGTTVNTGNIKLTGDCKYRNLWREWNFCYKYSRICD